MKIYKVKRYHIPALKSSLSYLVALMVAKYIEQISGF
jgi:hypothetical protein